MASAWEQYKLEDEKMLENGPDFHASGACGVGRVFNTIHPDYGVRAQRKPI
jgi:hypothetical protein